MTLTAEQVIRNGIVSAIRSIAEAIRTGGDAKAAAEALEGQVENLRELAEHAEDTQPG